MAHYWTDNVHTTTLTPREYQVELLAAASEQNLIVCLGHNSSKEFIAQKLIHEQAYQLRRQVNRKISLFLCADGNSTYNLLFHLTDLQVCNLNKSSGGDIDWEDTLRKNHVIILNPELCVSALICSYLDLESVNLIVIDDCHLKKYRSNLDELFEYYKNCEEKPKILGLAGPLHSAGCTPGHLGAELEHLEKALHCRAESASDIVTVLRYCTSPVDIVLQCLPPAINCEVSRYLRDLVHTKLAFLKDHRFDPSEIYSDEFLEEIQSYPDPKTEPLELLLEYLQILDQLGVWCADRAALNLLMRIEKLKVKTPYERHFLLLCLVSTCFVQIRAYCENVFSKLPSEKERILTYSTPKVRRLIEVLVQFNQNKNKWQEQPAINDRVKPVLDELDALNFTQCQKDLENTQKRVLEMNEDPHVVQLTDGINRLLNDGNRRKNQSPYKHRANRPNRSHYPPRTGPRQRSNWYQHNDPDALCGLIFCNSKVIAKILYNLLYEMSRHDENLNYLAVQFTVDRVADPITESKEAETEHRKQEEVLKRFRMHECNLLIGTAVLEEGIDLPKCNLVIRWDAPNTYRSYVQCKGKARAPNAYHIIMVAPSETNYNANYGGHSGEIITGKSHRVVCPPNEKWTEMINELALKKTPTTTNGNEEIDHVFSDDVAAEIVELPNHSNGDISNEAAIPHTNNDQKPVWLQNPKKLLEKYVCASKIDEDFDRKTVQMEIEHFERNRMEMDTSTDAIVERLAEYMEIEKMLVRKCQNTEPADAEQHHADKFTALIEPYQPLPGSKSASVNLSTAVALVNKYCAKLPSDTFTKLTPLWRCGRTRLNGQDLFQYTIRLPINSPIKQDILGLPMPTRILARRMAALITCRILHRSGELDDSLQPIGKESFRAMEPDWENFELEKSDEDIVFDNSEPRPGTTKRRQYYYKRIASVFCSCRPTINQTCYLYLIKMTLVCPIPEEQNTRGRKIYPPEESAQCFGILTLKKIPKISPFPIFTRSGEVKVALELIASDVTFNEEQLQHINIFLNYTFTKVLRLQKYLMLFDADASDNSFFIVPTIRTTGHSDHTFDDSRQSHITVDWTFLEMISRTYNRMPEPVPEEIRKVNQFETERFRDAVVMPWYRNQDQPQYFYVAEICTHLSPESSFPGDNYKTFREYYYRKYGISIQDQTQPLLDVDHTSARLNFLTPRYVNRKGVALPTSSEETKRAKRENLEQKQILVPELCTIHPFPASLWRAAVCLPCILYRINALLLADEIRLRVSSDLSLGCLTVEQNDSFEWPMLNFGWSLAEVLKKSRELKSKESGVKTVELDEEPTNIASDATEAIENGTNKTPSKDMLNGGGFDSDDADVVDNECDGGDLLEIGTWSNEMADNMDEYDSFDSDDGLIDLPDNVKMCSTAKSRIQYGSPTSWEPQSSTKRTTVNGKAQPNSSSNNIHTSATGYFSESDDDSFQSDDEYESDLSSDNETNCLKIEFKGDNVAEAIESEEDIRKRQRQLEIINNINANEQIYQNTKNVGRGFDAFSDVEKSGDEWKQFQNMVLTQEKMFSASIDKFRRKIRETGMLVRHDEILTIRKKSYETKSSVADNDVELMKQLLPFISSGQLSEQFNKRLSIDDLYELYSVYFETNPVTSYEIEGTGDLFDQFNESKTDQDTDVKTVDLTKEEFYRNKVVKRIRNTFGSAHPQIAISTRNDGQFSFDYQPDLVNHPGPSPSIILQALTMSNANDGINLERLETIGDSFLKYAITTYLYCTYEDVHEGKLSHLRSKQVSNLNLYRLGRRKMFGESMIATKFEPHDNWLPPCYYVPKELEKALITARIPAYHWNLADLPNIKELSSDEICELVRKKTAALGLLDDVDTSENVTSSVDVAGLSSDPTSDNFTCFIPYNLVTQHSIPDKSIADCVEALIGAYLIDCGQRGALLFMAWLGIRVLPCIEQDVVSNQDVAENSATSAPLSKPSQQNRIVSNYGHWVAPKSPLLLHAPNPYAMLDRFLDGYDKFEASIGYQFRDRSYLLQAMTHASYSSNRLTDCYQRLEFLGDAVLDYLITRHLYEDPRQHSPGALTDLRSALVNNTIFASLAVRHGFHKYFRHLSPGLNEVIGRFVRIQHENGNSISEEFYLISEEECDEAEDVEVPKALGDVFESVAGAIFLDSNMSLDTVWRIYSNMMGPEIELFSNSVPKSPIRELLELEPETAKFSKPEKLADGRRVRVSVEVFGKGTYRGIGRNYRIAKCTAAKCALRQLKKQGLIRKHNSNEDPKRAF